jgi:hypothetical protein
MGKINEGILGGFSGKVGAVVGYKWNDINVMRGKPTFKKKRVYSEKQLKNQAQFGIAAVFGNSLTKLLNITFHDYAIKKTGRNAAISYIIKRAIKSTPTGLELDYEKIVISRGDLPGAEGATASTGPDSAITFSWTNNTDSRYAKAGDRAIIVLYCPQLKKSLYTISEATRSSSSIILTAPGFRGHTVHSWIGFITANEKEKADSVYTGALAIV